MAVAPLGYIFSRSETSSATPSWRKTFATWMPAVDALMSGTKIASASSSALRRLAASRAETRGSAWRTASAVSTRPISEIEPVGAGEAAHGPVTAAIANAVFDALGLRVRNLPITRERLIAAMDLAS